MDTNIDYYKQTLQSSMQSLTARILEISWKHKLAHIGSCLTALPIVYNIYKNKHNKDIFILSNGHAGLAQYVVLEHFYGINAEDMYLKDGLHPCRNKYVFCSTGSLGLGITIAIGAALADGNRDVYCLISDGECAEGSVWEALNCKEKFNINNLKIHVNMNGYCAYDVVNEERLSAKLKMFCPDIIIHKTSPNIPFLKGIDAHYHVMTEEDYFPTTTSG